MDKHPAWEKETDYAVGDKRMDSPAGGNYECLVAHTSGAGTFAQDRSAHPSNWKKVT